MDSATSATTGTRQNEIYGDGGDGQATLDLDEPYSPNDAGNYDSSADDSPPVATPTATPARVHRASLTGQVPPVGESDGETLELSMGDVQFIRGETRLAGVPAPLLNAGCSYALPWHTQARNKLLIFC